MSVVRSVRLRLALLATALFLAACSMPPPKPREKPGASAPVASTSAEPLWLRNTK